MFFRNILFYLLVAYMFVVQLGNLFRIGGSENSLGLSTLLALTIIVLGIANIRSFVFETPVVLLLVALFLISTASMFFSPFKFDEVLKSQIEILLYLLLALVVASQKFSDTQVTQLLLATAMGLLASSSLTILDFTTSVNIPRCNEIDIGSRIRGVYGEERIQQASGFFYRRTAMAAYYSISITAAYFLFVMSNGWRLKAITATSVASGIVCLMLTHNRSCVVAVVSVVFVYFVSQKQLSARQFRNFATTGVICFLIGVIVWANFQEHVASMTARSAYMFGGDGGSRESDLGRFRLLAIAVNSSLEYPIGRGLTDLQLPSGAKYSPHNIITFLIWGVGLIAFAWIPIFALILVAMFRRKRSALFRVVAYCLLAFAINNMFHDSLSTGAAWVLLGLFIQLFYGNDFFMPSGADAHLPLSMIRFASGQGCTADHFVVSEASSFC